MKFEIVKMANPADPLNKAARPTLLFAQLMHKGELWQIVFPMTSNECQRLGHVFLSENSPAFKSTGLSHGCTIKLTSAYKFRVMSESSINVQRTGHWLNTAKDTRLQAMFAVASKEAAKTLCDLDLLPVAF